MTRNSRLRQYANPSRRGNWDGESSDKANLDRWSDRASENSKPAPRARSGPMKLPDTGKMNLGSTSDAASNGGKITAGAESGVGRLQKAADVRGAAKADKNFAGEVSYMAGVRRQA